MQQLEYGQLQMISLLVGYRKIASLLLVSSSTYKQFKSIKTFLGRRRPFIIYYTSAVAVSLSVLYMSEAGFRLLLIETFIDDLIGQNTHTASIWKPI